ncbi:MAG: type II secretion system GspH family protein [Candidatus Nomurabacteria bacterium]|jgi:type II secretory pathway pseudopilin PulG|nr:type II secretion system GspH family protein [Candidatus Nomurabacteria bacterium]
MKNEKGFTVIEIIIAAVMLVVLGIFFLIQKNELETTARDQERKTAINSIYYGLTEVFYQENQFYPTSVDEDNLRAVDPALFIDTTGAKINSTDGEYFYEGIDCDMNGQCQSFKLTAILEKESEYIRRPE